LFLAKGELPVILLLEEEGEEDFVMKARDEDVNR